MADQSLLDGEITVDDRGVNRSVLPQNFSQVYAEYVLKAGGDTASVANRANQAAQGAYDAQVKNDEQDVAIEAVDTRLIFVEGDYISKTVTDPQALASSLDVSASYSVDGTKVVGPQQMGWTPGSGTEFKGAFDADLTFTASLLYTQAEIQALADGLKEARQRILALEMALRTHGLIA